MTDHLAPLKAVRQWVCFDAVKVPINARTGGRAASNTPSTWSTYQQVVAFWEKNSDRIKGVGFVFGPSDPFIGIDLDHCLNPETGEIEGWAGDVVEQIGSYVEISPSGDGLHLICRGQVPFSQKKRTVAMPISEAQRAASQRIAAEKGTKQGKTEILIVQSGQYFTITGEPFRDIPITEASESLAIIYDKYFSKGTPSPSKRIEENTPLTDEEIIAKASAAKNFDRFRRLFSGDWTGYSSQSEADAALVSLIVFYTQDADQIERIFARSGLMRDKWSREDYRERTISYALSQSRERYTPPENKAEKGDGTKKGGGKDWIQQRQEEVVQEFNKKYAVIEGPTPRILRERYDPEEDGIVADQLAPSEFRLLTQNEFVPVLDGGNGVKNVSAYKYWLESPKRRQFKQVVFLPGLEREGFRNLWRGFAVEPREGDCRLYLDHLFEVICAGDYNLTDWVTSWLADAVQRPRFRPGTALVIRGRQGAGKGVFVREFGRLFGSHFRQIHQMRHLTGNFNSHLRNCLVLYADEAFWAGDKSAEGPLKGLITEDSLLIERKGIDPEPVPNLIRVIISSNSDWIVPAGVDERRFCVLDASEAHMQDSAYFGAIVEQMKNGGREALLHYLLNWDLSDTNLRHIPRTSALVDQKVNSLDPVMKWWLGILTDGILLPRSDDEESWPSEVSCGELHKDYVNWAGVVGERRRADSQSFGRIMRKISPSLERGRESTVVGGKRRWIYKVPLLEVCRREFVAATYTDWDWPE